jgi:hypothetical protein
MPHERLGWLGGLLVCASVSACDSDVEQNGDGATSSGGAGGSPTTAGPGGSMATGGSMGTSTGGGPQDPHAFFTITEGGVPTSYAWSVPKGNLVFCRDYPGQSYLWARFAESLVNDGEASPHVDIDVCKPGSGAFGPMNPALGQCGAQPQWDIWWHPSAASYANNAPNASPCTLTLSQNGGALSGTFECEPLVPGNLSVTRGSFGCTIEPGM